MWYWKKKARHLLKLPMTAEALAPAKINLSLHVTGKREDGYHLLDSLVVFADFGDRLRITPAAKTTLHVTGPLQGGVPTDESNLVVRAAMKIGVTAEIALEKHLPNAAGIGSGSSDAGAALRALGAISGKSLPDNGLSLGADVPVCLYAKAARMQGVGEQLTPVIDLPDLYAVLANPMVPVPTGPVFQALKTTDNTPMPDTIPAKLDTIAFAEWLSGMRNDLEAPAIAVEPTIAATLGALSSTKGCLLARMSGSGATCFGLFPNAESAAEAASHLSETHPGWWVCSVKLS